jgi:hypothetical protein
MVLSICSSKQTTKFMMEIPDIPMAHENLHVKITNEDNAHHCLSISRALFTLNSFHSAKQSTKLIIWKY